MHRIGDDDDDDDVLLLLCFHGNLRARGGTVLPPKETLEAFGNCMAKYEHGEIKGYDVWFLGLHAMKIHGSKVTGIFNHGFDNEQYFSEQVTRDHIAYRYEVLGVLGNGVYGQVLKCFDHQHNELVAHSRPGSGLVKADVAQRLSAGLCRGWSLEGVLEELGGGNNVFPKPTSSEIFFFSVKGFSC
ncbi:unnamed protein product [Arctogadus glacialis]